MEFSLVRKYKKGPEVAVEKRSLQYCEGFIHLLDNYTPGNSTLVPDLLNEIPSKHNTSTFETNIKLYHALLLVANLCRTLKMFVFVFC